MSTQSESPISQPWWSPPPSRTPVEAIRVCTRKPLWGSGNGRASRTEFWYFTAFAYAVTFAFRSGTDWLLGYTEENIPYETLDSNAYSFVAQGLSLVSLILFFAIGIPALCVQIRRLHDVGRSGLWLLVPIVGLVLCLLPGQPHVNRYDIAPPPPPPQPDAETSDGA